MSEDKTIGRITWHTSDEDSGPDVGISLYLGENERIYVGEISRALFERCGGPEHFDSDGGWFIVHFKPEGTELIAKCGENYLAQAFIEEIGSWRRDSPLTTP